MAKIPRWLSSFGLLVALWAVSIPAYADRDRGRGRRRDAGSERHRTVVHSRPPVRLVHDRKFHRPAHLHHYHRPGYRVRVLPDGYFNFSFGGIQYYYLSGVFYHRGPAGFVVVPAPIGGFVRILPPAYTVIYVGSRPYYYANDAYYVLDDVRSGYVVVEKPEEAESQLTVRSQLFVYPKLGQSEEQQAEDRYRCHRWAVDQTGFDPSDPPLTPSAEVRSDYRRAMTACLTGRGYTVK